MAMAGLYFETFSFMGFALQKASMRPRHAAALALVGWYLMLPPIDVTTRAFLTDRPLSQWHVSKGFDSAKECEAFLADEKEMLSHPTVDVGERTLDLDLYIGRLGSTRERMLRGLGYSQCIDTDDSRLKGP